MKQRLPCGKLCAIILGCLLFCNSIEAQYITIPDSNFVNWLKGNGYANCFTGNQMDTLCADTVVIIQNPLNISGQSITDFTGLRYVHWYDNNYPQPEIDLRHNNLTKVPLDLIYKSAHLQLIVDLDYNQIDTLNLDTIVAEGANIYIWNISHNNMNKVIGNNASHIIEDYGGLVLDYNNLDTLPYIGEALSNGWYISFRHNKFRHYPAIGHPCQSVDCGANLIDSIPTNLMPGTGLGSGATLICDSNMLRNLTVNSLLTQLICSYNQISNISNCGYIYWLHCDYNQITSLDTLSPYLYELHANNNNLSSIPKLGTNVYLVNVNSNPLLQCIPNLPNVPNLELDFDSTAILCLPRQFPDCNYTGVPGINSVPTCNMFNNVYGCPQYSNLEGFAYFDTITNCQLTAAEPVLPYVKVEFLSGGIVTQQIYSDYRGHYSFDELDTGVYSLDVDTSEIPFSLNCPDSFYYSANVDSQKLYQSGFNFGFVCKPGFDVGVFGISDCPLFHPGSVTTVVLTAGDLSNIYGMHCAAGVNGQVSLNYSGPITYIGPATGSLTPTTVLGNTVTWTIVDYGTINPFNDFNLLFETDTSAQNQEQVCFTANVTPLTGDNNRNNNTSFFCTNVITSWDPNHKEVYPSGKIDSAQKWLTYTIHFKNTGNATAVSVYILDTLSSYLDPATIKVTGFNYQNVVQVLPGGIVKFNFPFINLPDSASNDSASSGFIQYKISLGDNLQIGSIINNTATIYFDYNSGINTNTVTDTVSNCTINGSFTTGMVCAGDTFFMGTIAYTQAGTYIDTLTNIDGCDSIVTLKLTVKPLPPAATVIAQGHTLQASISLNYQWYLNDTLLAGDTSATLFVTLNGSYQVKVKGANGCSSISLPYNDTLADLPIPVIVNDSVFNGSGYNQAPPNVFECHMQIPAWATFRLINGSLNADSVVWTVTPYECFWRDINGSYTCDSFANCLDTVFKGDTVTLGQLGYDYRSLCFGPFGSNGNSISYVIICLTAYNQYGSASFCDTTCQLYYDGIQDIAPYSISLYPNPTTDLIYIKTEGIQPQTNSIYNVNGQLVNTMRFTPQVDVSKLTPGVYLIEVNAPESTARRMFVKM